VGHHEYRYYIPVPVLRKTLQNYTQPLSASKYVADPIYKRITDVTNAPLHVIKADDGVEVQLHSISISVLGVGERSTSSLATLSPVSFEYEAGWDPQRV
jgi:hypothetical protein